MADRVRPDRHGNPFGMATLLPIVLGIAALGVGGLFSAATGNVLGIVVGIVAAALLWAFPFLTGRVTVEDFRHSPETILIGSDDRLSSPAEDRHYQYLVDGELRDRPPEPMPGPEEREPEAPPGQPRE